MTHDERRELARALAAIDLPHPLFDPVLRRRRRTGLLVMTACCVALAAWIAILLQTLPGRYTSSDWRAVWVGLDVAELLAFAATAWAAWHQRQVLIFLMVITGTLLVCDAWFDITLDLGTSDVWWSVASAVLVELPLAAFFILRALVLIKLTILQAYRQLGIEAQPPPFLKVPLFGLTREPEEE